MWAARSKALVVAVSLETPEQELQLLGTVLLKLNDLTGAIFGRRLNWPGTTHWQGKPDCRPETETEPLAGRRATALQCADS